MLRKLLARFPAAVSTPWRCGILAGSRAGAVLNLNLVFHQTPLLTEGLLVAHLLFNLFRVHRNQGGLTLFQRRRRGAVPTGRNIAQFLGASLVLTMLLMARDCLGT